MNDAINPEHYRRFPIEVIELAEWLPYNRGNVIKYVCRAGYKDPAKEVEDLTKAMWYIGREIDRITRS